MGAKQRVYVSSTFVDLKEHRAALKFALEKAQYDVECMEKYPAFDERPMDKCLADVSECDCYVLLIAHRYGFEPPADNPDAKSITQLEYEHARRCNKPCLVFVVDEDEPWRPRFMDEGVAKEKLDAFRKAVGLDHGISTFTTAEDLVVQVMQALRAREENERQEQQREADRAVPSVTTGAIYRWPAAWNFGPYMADKREVFVGRDWLFADIADWMATGHPRALLIRADFGIGKSAILAELVHRNPDGVVAAWHFCQHDTQETLRPATFVRSFAAQLKVSVLGFREAVEADADLQDRLDRAAADPASALEAAILAPLSRLEAPPGGHRLLIVDALDEALELGAGRKVGTLVSLLAGRAGRFPEWLRILAASRNNPQVIAPLRQAFGLKEIDAESAANQDDLRRYILGRCTREPLASRLAGTGWGPDRIAALLGEKSLGKFLYAVRALRDLEHGAITPVGLARLPPGMDSFYLDAFERRFARTGIDYASVRDVLGIVATAREPLPAATIAQVLGRSEAQVKAVHRALPDFLRLRDGALAFEHFSMAEWLTRETEEGFPRAGDYAADVPASTAALHRWALARVDDGTAHESDYLLRHLASHLADAGERHRVFAKLMLSDLDWLVARLRTAGPEGLIADCNPLGDIPEAPLLRAVWRNSAHVLRRFVDQLPAQLLGRIRSLRDAVPPALSGLADRMRSWIENRPAGAGIEIPLVPLTGSLRFSTGLVETFTGHAGGVQALVALPGGRIASGGDDHTVRVWDLQGGHAAQLSERHAGEVLALVALPDGRIASGGSDGTVRVWDLQAGHAVQVFEGHVGEVRALVVLPDGRIASGGSDGTVRVWDPRGGHAVQVFEGHLDGVRALVALPDGRIASGALNGTVRIWDPQGRHIAQVFEGHADWVLALVVLPDGRVASGGGDGTVRVWDPQGSHAAQVFEGHSNWVSTPLVLPDGKPERGAEALLNANWVSTLVVLPDGRIASGSGDRTVQVWDPLGVHAAQVFEGHADWVLALVVLPDGRIASGGMDGTVRVWDPLGGHVAQVFEGHAGGVRALIVLPDGRVASGGDDRTVRVWDLQGGHAAQLSEGHVGGVRTLVALPGGRIASGGDDHTVRVWDLQGGHAPQLSEGHVGGVRALVVLPDGRIASSGSDGTVRVWDLQGGHAAQVFEGHVGGVRALVVLPDGRIASGGSDGTVRLWDLQGGHAAQVFEGHADWVSTLVVLPDGRIASGSGDRTVRIWDPLGSHAAQVFEGHADWVLALVVLADGRIASGGGDGTVRVWNAQTGHRLALFVADAAITALHTTSDGLIVAGDAGGAVHFLKLVEAQAGALP